MTIWEEKSILDLESWKTINQDWLEIYKGNYPTSWKKEGIKNFEKNIQGNEIEGTEKQIEEIERVLKLKYADPNEIIETQAQHDRRIRIGIEKWMKENPERIKDIGGTEDISIPIPYIE